MKSTSTQTTYTELASVLDSLPLILRETRRSRGLSQRAAAREASVSFSTIRRVEEGEDPVMSTVTAILRWLDAGRP